MISKSSALFCLFLVVVADAGYSSQVQRMNIPGAAGAPFFSGLTYVLSEGPTLQKAHIFLSGVVATPFPSKPGPPVLVPGGISIEANQTLSNIVTYMEYAYDKIFGAPLGDYDVRQDITKCRVYLGSITAEEESTFNSAYVAFFNGIVPPARVAFRGAELVVNAKCEVECDAYAVYSKN